MASMPAPPFYPLTEDNHAALVVVASLVLLIYASVGVAIKLFIRLSITSMKDFDIILIIGSVVYVIQTACVIAACDNGLGQHQKTLPQQALERFSKCIYASRMLAVVVHGCAKTSVCLLIRQISNDGLLRKANIFLEAIILAWVLSGLLSTAFQCSLPAPWMAQECYGMERIFIYNGIMSLMTDVGLCLLPVGMMWNVQATLRKKVIVTTLFGSRLLVVATTIPSLSTTPNILEYEDDWTWQWTSSTIWFQISLGLSVFTACIPSLKGVIDSLLGATAVTSIQSPYKLQDSGNKTGLTAISIDNGSKSASQGTSASRGTARRGSTAFARWKNTEHHTSIASRVREDSLGESESVRKLTEGIILVRDEVEVAFDRGAAADLSQDRSRQPSVAGPSRV